MTRLAPVGPVKLDGERLEFLQHARAVRPELLGELHELLPEWRGAPSHARGRLLYEWAERFRLYVPWVLRFARARLHSWSAEEEGGREAVMEWTRDGLVTVYRMETAPPITLTWEPDTESRAAFERRALDQVRAHADATEARLAGQSDWQPQRSTRGGGAKRNPPEPLRWLAEYQVGGRSFYSIAKRAKVDQSGVNRTVRAAAKRIELPLRTP